jgi:hypothetical protein
MARVIPMARIKRTVLASLLLYTASAEFVLPQEYMVMAGCTRISNGGVPGGIGRGPSEALAAADAINACNRNGGTTSCCQLISRFTNEFTGGRFCFAAYALVNESTGDAEFVTWVDRDRDAAIDLAMAGCEHKLREIQLGGTNDFDSDVVPVDPLANEYRCIGVVNRCMD